jgi:hypothetical protein
LDIKLRQETTLKKKPNLSFLWQFLVVLALAVAIVTIISSFYRANNPPIYFTVINGKVTASDGNIYSDAKEGKKIPLNVLTKIKTGSQVTSIQLWNGSVVILDSDSSIEFNRPKGNDTEISFAFNLLKGRVLVVNEKNTLMPVRIFIGSVNTVRASQSAMGLEVFPDSKILNQVNCLFGKCLINGSHLLLTDQNAQIGPGEIIQVTEGESIADWISLWNAGNLKQELKNQLVSFLPTFTPTIIQTKPILSTDQAFLFPSSTLIVLQNVTPSRTNFTFPSPTLTPSRTIKPLRLPSFTKTLSQENDPSPSRTLTPSRTPVPTATPSQTLTPTLLPTFTPSPSNTTIPSDTPSPFPTNTSTPIPTETPTKTKPKPPTDTPEPPTPTNTEIPPPTATEVPQPTPTEVRLPTSTEVPV